MTYRNLQATGGIYDYASLEHFARILRAILRFRRTLQIVSLSDTVSQLTVSNVVRSMVPDI